MYKKIILLILCLIFVISCSSPSNPDGGSTTPTEEELLVEKYGIDISQEDSVISQQIEKNLKDYFTEKGSYRVILTGIPKDYTQAANESLYTLILKAASKINTTMNVEIDLKNINFQDSSIKTGMFSGDIVDNSENIVISFVFPNDKIKTIEMNSFDNLSNTKEIIIPDSVITISEMAFYFSISIEKLILSTNLKTIGDQAFLYAQGLKELVIPDSVTSIGSGAFGDIGLQKLQLSSSLESIGMGAFTPLDVTELTIPASVKSIGSYAFGNSQKLTTVIYYGTSPSTINNNDALLECLSLTTLKVPNAPETTPEDLKSKWQNFLGGSFTTVTK